MRIGNLSKRLEIITNVAVLASCVITIVFLIRYGAPLFHHRQTLDAQAIAVGDQLNVPGVDWGAKSKTLLLVMQSTCSHCTASAPAFRQLAAKAASLGNVGVIAIFPQQEDHADSYLKTLNLPLPFVRVALASIHVGGTPTVLLCDRAGRIQATWAGELDAARTSAILNLLTSKG